MQFRLIKLKVFTKVVSKINNKIFIKTHKNLTKSFHALLIIYQHVKQKIGIKIVTNDTVFTTITTYFE